MRIKNILIIIFIFLGIFSFAENIEDNEFYKKGVELLNLAKLEYEKGDYDRGYEYSEQAKENFTKAHEYNLIRILTLRLNKEREITVNYIERVKSSGMNNNINSAKYYNDAVMIFDKAETSYSSGNEKTDFKEKGDLFQQAIDNYMESSKLCEMALRSSSRDRDDAEKLIEQAKNKRNDMIKNNIIKTSDQNDKEIMKIINESSALLKNKDYSSSISKSNEAIDLMDKIKLKKEAEELLSKAKNLFKLSKEKGAENDFPEKFNEANEKLSDADKYYNESNYAESINNSKKALEILNSFGYKFDDVLPKYYKIRNLRPTADCFWKISEYPFIYNDSSKWKIIYEANKNKLIDINNPDIIHPDVILIIPDISDEKREGEYDPDKKYPEFKSDN